MQYFIFIPLPDLCLDHAIKSLKGSIKYWAFISFKLNVSNIIFTYIAGYIVNQTVDLPSLDCVQCALKEISTYRVK